MYVHLSVCPSFVILSKRMHIIIKVFPLSSASMTVVFFSAAVVIKFQGELPKPSHYLYGSEKTVFFLPKSLFISENVRDCSMVIIDHK